MAHVGFVADGPGGGWPVVVPLGIGRDRDRVLVHGSTGSRAFRRIAAGVPTCLTVTEVDGLVLARAAVEASMRYRSAMVFGSFAPITDLDERAAALERISEHVLPGRWREVRAPTRKELAATAVLWLPIEEWSVKVNDGWPTDEGADLDLDVWAGVVPWRRDVGEPQPDPALRPGISLPASLTTEIADEEGTKRP